LAQRRETSGLEGAVGSAVGSSVLLELVRVGCALCGSKDTTGAPCFEGYDVEFRTCANRFTFVQCAGCGHVYLSPRPREADFDRIYANYLTHNTSSAYHPSKLVAWAKRNLFDRPRMKEVLGRLGEGANVLEIGAGSGQQLRFVGEMLPHPVNLYANDVVFDPVAREDLRRRGVRILEGFVEKVDTSTRFDAIFGVHVIEHVTDPVAVFAWISAHLAPGGMLYLETPDTAAPARRIFKSNWGMTHFPRHFHLFSREKLAGLARDSGLEVVRHRATTSAPAWNMSIRNSLKMDALTKHRTPFEIFNYSNVFTLTLFTLLDMALMLAGLPTSTQQLVARRNGDAGRR
jgi:2-polyprenyl-3-methyl-5-hydroxy-6-metoxy-1,4-benzoquinol methylase